MKRIRNAMIVAVATVGVFAASEAPASAQSGQCTASFHVIHDDHIGRLQVPAGIYQLVARGGLSCTQASALWTQFLNDFDGRLPSPWKLTVKGSGRGRFVGSGGQRFFTKRTGSANSNPKPGPARKGGGSHGDLLCPGTFQVEDNDRIGNLRLPAGPYQVTLLGGNLTCSTASRLFAQFLQRPTGNLPDGWSVLPQAGEFVRGTIHYGFRVKQV